MSNDHTADLVVVRSKHFGRWIAIIVIAVLAVMVLRSVFTNPRFGWETVGLFFRDTAIFNGIGVTLFLTVVSMLIGIVLGIIVAVMRVSHNPIISGAASLYQLFFRGTPVLVQLLFWFNLAALYPSISFGIPGVELNANDIITPMTAAILGLGLNESAYMSEIVRAGILSVDKGQSDAASGLGMNRIQTMRRIILPQAMRVIIPPTGNEVIGMLKATSLVSVIAVPELLYSSQIIYSKNLQIIPLLIVASLWYIIITSILGIGQSFLERRFARGSGHPTQKTIGEHLRRAFRMHATEVNGTKL
ncbi:amino acid ABC transporter permease [Leucobacter sp. UT-8R-CII-1-4]|uniref:amino acid ABC transporter permease n=1 Tax=Leucobacter sp. UT-8R-CII-1-4 TaxID=3040075 RepID=UPI0024A96978|nr:amino acid ABC transporter permease [Leucobacter sp. UT-8R-CII-1-4]MDI6023252.1 amino acid ABC transporter permease [Leucobacter sp. UT-8R-CII-1-4]